jgi:chorismate mutase
MNLEEMRKKIDEIDAKVVDLISRTPEISVEIGRENRRPAGHTGPGT